MDCLEKWRDVEEARENKGEKERGLKKNPKLKIHILLENKSRCTILFDPVSQLLQHNFWLFWSRTQSQLTFLSWGKYEYFKSVEILTSIGQQLSQSKLFIEYLVGSKAIEMLSILYTFWQLCMAGINFTIEETKADVSKMCRWQTYPGWQTYIWSRTKSQYYF